MSDKHNYLGSFEMHVMLVVLRLKGEGYGASILKEIDSDLIKEKKKRVTVGALYTTLDRLESKNLLQSRDVVDETYLPRRKKPKRLYNLTESGAIALREMRFMFESYKGVSSELGLSQL